MWGWDSQISPLVFFFSPNRFLRECFSSLDVVPTSFPLGPTVTVVVPPDLFRRRFPFFMFLFLISLCMSFDLEVFRFFMNFALWFFSHLLLGMVLTFPNLYLFFFSSPSPLFFFSLLKFVCFSLRDPFSPGTYARILRPELDNPF